MQSTRLPSLRCSLFVALVLMTAVRLDAQLTTPALPAGFEHTVFYSDSLPVTAISFDLQGRLYVANLYGQITIVEDTDGDLVGDTTIQFFDGSTINGATTGILYFQNKLYVSYAGTVMTLEDTDGDDVADLQTVLQTNLPFNLHQNNGLFTDGSWIYFGIGSLTDSDVEPAPSGTLVRMSPDGSIFQVYATGLRNVYDGVWHPATSSLFVGDNGPNFVPAQPHPDDEINRVQQGQDYGHPQNWGTPPPGAGTVGPYLLLPPHTAPTGMAVNPNKALSGFLDEVWIAGFSGGIGVMPVVPGTGSGSLASWLIPFANGFNKPTDILFGPKGELFVAEYQSRVVRVVHQSHPVVLTAMNTPSIASIFNLRIASVPHAGATYFIAASDAKSNPTVVAPGIALDLDLNSWVTSFSLTPGNGIFFFPVPGQLDAAGEDLVDVFIPYAPQIVGMELHYQALVFNPSSTPAGSSPPLTVPIVPIY